VPELAPTADRGALERFFRIALDPSLQAERSISR
jgi:hypothetical protein